MIQLIKTNLSEIEGYRDLYLNSLCEFQELFLEMMVPESSCYIITDSNKTVGYTIVTNEQVMIEFYLIDGYIPKCSHCFSTLIKELSIVNIYCKSFDSLLLNCCLMQNFNYSILGALYRDFQAPEIDYEINISAQLADNTKVRFLLNQGDGIEELFENQHQLNSFIDSDTVIMFFQKDVFVGCGTILRTHPKWTWHDLGIWVKSEFRMHGIATQMLVYMRNYCLEKEWKCTCGCAIENIASQKTIEKSGFISKHKMMDFRVGE